jgi:hypothetical protein
MERTHPVSRHKTRLIISAQMPSLTDHADDLKDLTVTFDISEGLVCILALTGPI